MAVLLNNKFGESSEKVLKCFAGPCTTLRTSFLGEELTIIQFRMGHSLLADKFSRVELPQIIWSSKLTPSSDTKIWPIHLVSFFF